MKNNSKRIALTVKMRKRHERQAFQRTLSAAVSLLAREVDRAWETKSHRHVNCIPILFAESDGHEIGSGRVISRFDQMVIETRINPIFIAYCDIVTITLYRFDGRILIIYIKPRISLLVQSKTAIITDKAIIIFSNNYIFADNYP